MGRLLMNVMLASGGDPWTVIPQERRADYMAALESASVDEGTAPFTRFIASLVEALPDGTAVATAPRQKPRLTP